MPGFVGLDRADEVPLNLIKIPEGRDLVQGLLKVVFTKGYLTGVGGGPEFVWLAGLADCQQAHTAGLPARLQCCFLYASGYAPDVVCYAAHSVSLPLLD